VSECGLGHLVETEDQRFTGGLLGLESELGNDLLLEFVTAKCG